MTKENSGGLQRFTDAAVSVLGAAASVGAGILTQNPTVGIAAGVAVQALVDIGTEVSHRALSPRQEKRIGEVLVLAAAAVVANETMGRPVRNDGFFDGERSDADEIIEGVLLAAMTTHEERKLPYLANLLASFVCGDVSADGANYILREAEEASWLELRLLSLFTPPRPFAFSSSETGDAAGPPLRWPVVRALDGCGFPGKGYLELTNQQEGILRLGLTEVDLNFVGLTDLGQQLVDHMGLGSIPKFDKQVVYNALVSDP